MQTKTQISPLILLKHSIIPNAIYDFRMTDRLTFDAASVDVLIDLPNWPYRAFGCRPSREPITYVVAVAGGEPFALVVRSPSRSRTAIHTLRLNTKMRNTSSPCRMLKASEKYHSSAGDVKTVASTSSVHETPITMNNFMLVMYLQMKSVSILFEL